MPTRLRLSCRALLFIVLVRPNFYSALCLAIVQFSSPFILTDNNLIDYYRAYYYIQLCYLLVRPILDLHFSFYSLASNVPQLSWAPGFPPAKSGPGQPIERHSSVTSVAFNSMHRGRHDTSAAMFGQPGTKYLISPAKFVMFLLSHAKRHAS